LGAHSPHQTGSLLQFKNPLFFLKNLLPEGSAEDPIFSKIIIQKISPDSLGGNYTFEWDSQMMDLYESDKETPVGKDKNYPAAQEHTFYAKPKKESSKEDDLDLKVSWTSEDGKTTIKDADILSITAVKVELTLYSPGKKSTPGAAIERPTEEDQEYAGILIANNDDDDKRSTPEKPAQDNDDTKLGDSDNDIVQVELGFLPTGLGNGTLEVVLPTEKIRAFDKDGKELKSSDLTIDLKSPQGPLADLKKKMLPIFLEGKEAHTAAETLKFTYKRKDTIREDKGTLLPIEMKIVDRDDPKKKWGSEKNHTQSKPIYSGQTTGDMVSWKLAGADSWTNVTFTWSAEGPDGETIAGPTGAGENEWTINDNDDDTAANSLTWKPGNWKIKVQSGAAQTEFEQEIGWRTEDYVVIGQIVPTNTHDNDAPRVWELSNPNPNPDEIPNTLPLTSPMVDYRRAILYDILDSPLLESANDSIREAIAITPLPITAKLTEAWFGYWYLMKSIPFAATPKGPFTEALPSGNGNVQYGHRFWALQHVFNVSPDAPLVPQTFSDQTFDTIKADEQYRVIHRYTSKFLVTDDGKIDSNKVFPIEEVAEAGPTKMNFGIAAGEFSPIWDNPAYKFFSLPKQPPETHPPYQGKTTVAQDGTKLSYYATGRVGLGGQNVNWRLMGKDAPWIFSEIIIELKADRTVAAQIKASVDKSWSETTGAVEGETAFNNLNLYKLGRNLQTDEFEFALQKLMPMEGELEPFINSASGQRPEPPIPPSVQ
jgi:hypothetical protein